MILCSWIRRNWALKCLRRDRRYDSRGGGILVFAKNNYKIISTHRSLDYEILSLTINLNNTNTNFICTYRSSSLKKVVYLDNLESFINQNINRAEPIFIIGDLNLQLGNDSKLISKSGKFLSVFNSNNNFINMVKEPNRVVDYRYHTRALLFWQTMNFWKPTRAIILLT